MYVVQICQISMVMVDDFFSLNTAPNSSCKHSSKSSCRDEVKTWAKQKKHISVAKVPSCQNGPAQCNQSYSNNMLLSLEVIPT